MVFHLLIEHAVFVKCLKKMGVKWGMASDFTNTYDSVTTEVFVRVCKIAESDY
jgi:hypothetical protein